MFILIFNANNNNWNKQEQSRLIPIKRIQSNTQLLNVAAYRYEKFFVLAFCSTYKMATFSSEEIKKLIEGEWTHRVKENVNKMKERLLTILKFPQKITQYLQQSFTEDRNNLDFWMKHWVIFNEPKKMHEQLQ